MAKIQLTQTGVEVQNDLDLVENSYAQFLPTNTYEIGDVVAYQGHLWECIVAVSTAGAWTGGTNWQQVSVKDLLDEKADINGFKTLNDESLLGSGNINIPAIAINPNDLADDDGEIIGLAVGSGDNRVRYKAQSLSKTDGITFTFGNNANFSFADSYSSYNRCGNIVSFVVACSITKNASTTDPITLGTFENIPNAIFAKLVPTTVGGSDYLENCDIKAFSSAYAFVNASIAMVKGNNQDVALTIETANLVENTKYHVRYMVSFLLTDNLSSTDPILSNNSWETIATVCSAGNAGNYWAVGDTKTDVGTDGYTRTFRIADMSGLYGKHVVFEQVALDGSDGSGASGLVWNPSSNTDQDSCYNNYNISQMRSTHLPAVLLRYSADLQAIITNTSYQVATNGNNGTLLTLTDKLFLFAAKEIGYTSYSRAEENGALFVYEYYQNHTSSADHIKYKNGDLSSAGTYWTRSPYSGGADSVVFVYNNGGEINSYASNAYRVAPCFAL